MYSAPSSIRAVAALILSSLCGTASFPQAVKFIRRAADPLPLANVSAGRASCTKVSASTTATTDAAIAVPDEAAAPCDTPPVTMPSVNPCNPARPGRTGCPAPRDPVQENLAAMGKTGQKIMQARERVLDILETENACSAWFRERDASPAATFRTLGYAIDRHGEEIVHVSRDEASQYTYRDPYVARVGQDTGAYATITLNALGAFFQTAAPTVVAPKEGGFSKIGGPRSLSIGPYTGDSAPARTLALLHEFGHVINLLPVDFDNEDGKSVQNTREVLRFCRAEIDSKAKRSTLSAAR
jgi:hypothetical protein